MLFPLNNIDYSNLFFTFHRHAHHPHIPRTKLQLPKLRPFILHLPQITSNSFPRVFQITLFLCPIPKKELFTKIGFFKILPFFRRKCSFCKYLYIFRFAILHIDSDRCICNYTSHQIVGMADIKVNIRMVTQIWLSFFHYTNGIFFQCQINPILFPNQLVKNFFSFQRLNL